MIKNMTNRRCFALFLLNISCFIAVILLGMLTSKASFAQYILAQSEESIDYEEFKLKSMKNIKEDLFRSIVESSRAKLIVGNNLELKIKSYGGDIFFRKHYSSNVDKNTAMKIPSQLHRYEKILDKKFVEKTFKELKNMNVSYFTFLFISKSDYYKISDLYKSDGVNIKIDNMKSFPCTVKKFSYGNDFIKQTMMVVVDTGDSVVVDNCIANVLFYAFYPGQLLGLIGEEGGRSLMGVQDLFNIRALYDDRMPFKMEKIENNRHMDVIIKETKSWLISCYENNKCK